MTNKDPSKYPYDRSEYVVMPPIRKAEDGTLTTDPQKVEGDFTLVKTEKQFDGKTFRLSGALYSSLQDISLTITDTSVLAGHTSIYPHKPEPQKVDSIPDGNFYDIKIEDCQERVYFDSFGNAHYAGTWVQEKCSKWRLGYVREDIYEQAVSRQPNHPTIDVEALKREVNKYLDEAYVKTNDEYENGIVASVIDHLASAGYFRAPLPRIEGLDDALIKYGYIADQEDSQLSSSEEWYPVDEFKIRSIVRAARAYLKASGV